MSKLFSFRRFMPVLIITLYWNMTSAQLAIGVSGGYTRNHYNSHMAASSTKNNQLSGFCTGIMVQYTHDRLFVIQTAVDIVQKNYSLQRTGALTGAYQSFKNTYIQLPLIGQIQARYKKTSFYCKAGVFGAYWMAAKMEGNIPNLLNSYTNTNNGTITDYFILTRYKEKYSFQSHKDRRFEFGWLTGAGISYHLTPFVSLFIEGRYYHSLTDQQKQYSIDHISAYNQTFSICAGGLFSLTYKKAATK